MQISELIEQASLADYVAQYTDLTLIKDEWWGISPLSKKDTDPSFSIRGKMYYDFSAGCGGNILDFIQRHDHCDFKTALNTLIEWLGLTDEAITDPPQIVTSLRSFKHGARRTKCNQRRLMDESELDQYKCKSFHWWDDEGLTSDVIAPYGIGYDRRDECITIPVRTNDGQLINILCRTTKEHAKALGIPKYIYKYKLGTLDFFWGWYENYSNIRRKKEVILVEGAKSVMKLAAMGFDNAVAVMTSHLSDEQMKFLVRDGVDVVVAFDKDVDPTKDDNIRRLSKYCRVYISVDRYSLLDEKDSPCDKGIEAWMKIYEGRRLLKC